MSKKIVTGASVEAKMTLFEVADLSTVWIEANVYEKDIPFLQVGQKAEATVEGIPGKGLCREVGSHLSRTSIPRRAPTAFVSSWTIPGMSFGPGMFATVRIKDAAGEHRAVPQRRRGAPPADRAPLDSAIRMPPAAQEFLVVPERAVVDTGAKKVVYVEREPGMFEGVEVQLGPAATRSVSSHPRAQAGRQGGRGRRFPDRRGNTAQSGRRGDLFRRQRRAAIRHIAPVRPSHRSSHRAVSRRSKAPNRMPRSPSRTTRSPWPRPTKTT